MRLAVCLISTLMLAQATLASASNDNLAPNVDLTPEQVVRIIIDALRNNTSSNNDAGIATVFCFASPGNRANTGPLDRFTTMVKRGFGDMLNHLDSDFDSMQIQGSKAQQAVWLITAEGESVGYVFQLGRQSEGEFTGMWMTDGVWPLGKSHSSGQAI